jgi:hypothetical protein
MVRIDISEYDNYLANGDVQGIEVKGDAVLVTIMKDSLIKEVHEKKLAGTSPEAGAAQYTFYIGNTPQMQQQVIEEARAKKVDVRIDQNDMGGDLELVLFFRCHCSGVDVHDAAYRRPQRSRRPDLQHRQEPGAGVRGRQDDQHHLQRRGGFG